MRLRPVAVLLALVALDYAVWNWSLAGGRDVAGMISGLTLPPLVGALLVVVAINIVRGLGDATRRSPRPAPGTATARATAPPAGSPARTAAPAIMKPDTEDQAAAASSRASSPKIAA